MQGYFLIYCRLWLQRIGNCQKNKSTGKAGKEDLRSALHKLDLKKKLIPVEV